MFIQWHKRLAKSLFMGAIKMLRFHSSQLGRSSRYSHRTEPAGGYYTETDIYMQNKPERKKINIPVLWLLEFLFHRLQKHAQGKFNITLMDIGMLVTCIHFFLQFLMIQNFFVFYSNSWHLKGDIYIFRCNWKNKRMIYISQHKCLC